MTSSKKRHSYSAEKKLEIVNYAFRYTQSAASDKFGINKSMVSRWIRDCKKIRNADPANRRIGAGRKSCANQSADIDCKQQATDDHVELEEWPSSTDDEITSNQDTSYEPQDSSV
jgi:transposase-like protein